MCAAAAAAAAAIVGISLKLTHQVPAVFVHEGPVYPVLEPPGPPALEGQPTPAAHSIPAHSTAQHIGRSRSNTASRTIASTETGASRKQRSTRGTNNQGLAKLSVSAPDKFMAT
jgi:hypothetical protein